MRMCMLILPHKCYLEHLETTVYWLIFKTWSLQDDLGPMTNNFSKWIDLPNEIAQVCILLWSDCTSSLISTSNKQKCSHGDLGTLTSVLIFVCLDVLFALPLPSCLPQSHLWFALETNCTTNPVGTVVFLVHTLLSWHQQPQKTRSKLCWTQEYRHLCWLYGHSFMLITVHMYWTSLTKKKKKKKGVVFFQQHYTVSEDCIQ